MKKEAAIGLAGTAGSVLLVILGYLIDIVWLQVIFSFLAGAFSTYLIQHKLQTETEEREKKKSNHILLRDNIYGPVYEAANIAFETLKSEPDLIHYIEGEYSPIDEIKRTTNSYFYLLIDEKTKSLIEKLFADLEEYQCLLSKAKEAIYAASYPVLMQYPSANVIPSHTFFRLKDHEYLVFGITLMNAILTDINPFSKMRSLCCNLEKPKIETRFPSIHAAEDPATAEKLYLEISSNARHEKRVVDYWAKRQGILVYLSEILPKLRNKVEDEDTT